MAPNLRKLTRAPKFIYKLLDSHVFRSQARTTTWMLLGGCLHLLLSTLLTPRLSAFLFLILLGGRLLKNHLIATKHLRNPELDAAIPHRFAASFQDRDASGAVIGASRNVTVLILGAKSSHPLGVFAPGVKELGAFMGEMMRDLNTRSAELGYLGGTNFTGAPNSGDENAQVGIIGYFKDMESLHAFAHSEVHRKGWGWWNKNGKQYPHLGIYHEAYDVPAHSWEAIYIQMAPTGLSACTVPGKEGVSMDMVTDARKWGRTSAQRMGRTDSAAVKTDMLYSE
ncbi:hypothetical protein EJ06DRAFT_578228 [Trichodelitschia bisporula]|uniref:Uncharacterized protein n=1 Tax=Trichodelitschia bisporula TaxID=703511 RepID=A0A6G1I9F6_9PEZI|nr:hypothetical protein EJ06DRAFT_578228 [Trichodelitschia bisporula]